MKAYNRLAISLAIALIFVTSSSAINDTTDYLEQVPPGYFPEVFAGDITDGSVEYCHSFSPDGKEMYFALYENGGYTIKYMEKIGDTWSDKKLASFCITTSGVQEASPCFSPDGEKIFYISNRSDGLGSWDIWYVERTDTGWSEPVNPGSPLNSASFEDYPFLSKDSIFYFNSERPGGFGSQDMYKATFYNGVFDNIMNLGDSINSADFDENPVVIGNKLIFGNRNKQTLNICYKVNDTCWSKPEIISGGTYQPGVYYGFRSSPDNKYFFFGRHNSVSTDEFWVDIKSLDYVGPKEAAFNYIAGWYGGNEEQMKMALHPNLAKRQVNSATGSNEVNYSWMLNAAKSCTGCISDITKGTINIEVLHSDGNIASIKAESNSFIDYLQVAKVNGQWKIINVLWNYKTSTQAGSAEEAELVASEYINSWYAGNNEMMGEALHPKFLGRRVLSNISAELIDYNWMNDHTADCEGCSESFSKTIEVIDFDLNIASVLIINGDSIEYLHMAYVGGKYKIVNSIRNYYLGAISSISNNAEKATISVYPNPCNDQCFVLFENDVNENVNLELYNSNGQFIETLPNGKENLVGKTLYILGYGLKPGLYFIKLSTKQYSITKKLAIMH